MKLTPDQVRFLRRKEAEFHGSILREILKDATLLETMLKTLPSSDPLLRRIYGLAEDYDGDLTTRNSWNGTRGVNRC